MRWLSIVKRNPFVLPMAVVAGLAMFFISEGSYWQSQDTISELRGLSLLRQDLVTLERGLADAESGQRSFLLTGRLEFLHPYEDSRRVSQEALAALDRHFAGSAASGAQMTELRAVCMTTLDALDETLRLMNDGQRAAALVLVSNGAGTRAMDRVRAITGQLMDEQETLRQSANSALDRTLLLSRYGVAMLSGVLMLALVLYLRKSDDLATVQETKKKELQAANDKLEAEVLQRTTELTNLTRHLLTAREDERHRLARNLHDDLGSLLTAAKLDAARIRSRLGPDAPEAQARLADLVDKLNSSIALGRSIIEDLRPSTLDHLGLAPTLELLAADFSQRAAIPVHTRFEPVRLRPGLELVVFRVVQEALTNLSKYAQASQVWITVLPEGTPPQRVKVSVRDDGAGFDANLPSRSAFGLLGMRFRVEAEGGSLRVHSQPGQGTHVEVSLPVGAQEN
jgi:signal transduction histidine kinase